MQRCDVRCVYHWWGKGCVSKHHSILAEAGQTYLLSLRLAQCALCYEEILTSLGFCQLETGVFTCPVAHTAAINKSDSL